MGKQNGHSRSVGGRRMSRRWRAGTTRVASLTVVASLVAAGTACEPPPPRQQLVVNTATPYSATPGAGDANPGDGVCETSPGSGVCTFKAAVEEGNALGRASILVPAGRHDVSSTVTGDLWINVGAPQAVIAQGAINVSGRLSIEGFVRDRINTGIPAFDIVYNFTIRVNPGGHLSANRVSLALRSVTCETVALAVLSGGSAYLQASQVQSDEGCESAVGVGGALVLDRSVVFAPYDATSNTPGPYGLELAPGSTVVISNSAIGHHTSACGLLRGISPGGPAPTVVPAGGNKFSDSSCGQHESDEIDGDLNNWVSPPLPGGYPWNDPANPYYHDPYPAWWQIPS